MTESGSSAGSSIASSTSAIGLRFNRHAAEARACWIGFDGSPLRNAPQIRASVGEPFPADLLRAWRAVERDESTSQERDWVTGELTLIGIRLCEQLMAKVSDRDDLLAIGVAGAGVWGTDSASLRSYCELISTSQLVEHFGITVVDDFPGRDLAQGGCGGPLEVHGLWILLADRSRVPGRRWRALLDMTPSATNFSMIGPPDFQGRSESILSHDICVGSRLLPELAMHADEQDRSDLPNLQQAAMSGKVVYELAEIWMATSMSEPTWHPDGVSTMPLTYALQNSIYAKTPLNDLLATATHFIARRIEHHAKYRIPATSPVGELFIMGEGSKNEMLVQWLDELLPEVPIRRLSDLGHDRTIHASSIAALTLLHVWQIPVPSTNSSETPRVLGRLTPGSPSNWRRVLYAMTSNAPWLLPLREAI